ncbi:MAG: HAD family hydrolase [Rhodothermia bacterium]
MKASVEHCKAFLFDWDGTLVDSIPIKISNAAELFSRLFEADRGEVQDSYAEHSGVPRRELFDLIALDCFGRRLTEPEFDRASSEFTALNRERIAARARLRSGSVEVLARLKEQGRLVFISTATTQDEIDPLAAGFGVATFCTEVLGSRPGFTKGPVHAAHVASRYGVQKHEMAGIGDDEHDMRLFSEAGITAVGITGTRSRPELEAAGADIVIENLNEVAPGVI